MQGYLQHDHSMFPPHLPSPISQLPTSASKGFVADGKVGGEGSTNWSVPGEGTFVVTGQAGDTGYKAQNNTQSIFTDPDTISRFSAELVAEHMTAQTQQAVTKASGQSPPAWLKPGKQKILRSCSAKTATAWP
jgi:hypothetical protein